MSLVRFDSSDSRGPSAQLWQGIVDWVRGSLASTLGPRDYDDFAPYTGPTLSAANGQGGGMQVSSLGDDPNCTLQTDRYGVIQLTEGNATNECVGFSRDIWYDLNDSPITAIEARIEVVSDANSPQLFVGFFDGAEPNVVFASGAIASGSNQDTLGLRWNADETVDIVAVVDGTLATLKDDIGVSIERTDGQINFGLRVERVSTSLYRLVPSINGTIARKGIVTVANTAVPSNPMRPTVALTTAATTDPTFEADWIFSAAK